VAVNPSIVSHVLNRETDCKDCAGGVNVLNMPVAAPTGQVAAQNRNASQAQNATSAGLAQSAQNSRITGKVQIGGGKEFKIEAKPPPRNKRRARSATYGSS
jgi:hypothetical protein